MPRVVTASRRLQPPMLRTRVITALALVGCLLPGLFFLPPLGWAFAMSLAAGIAAWEWGGLIRLQGPARLVLGGASVLVLATMSWLAAPGQGINPSMPPGQTVSTGIYACAVGFWTLVVPVWLRYRWQLVHPAIGLLVGLVVIAPTWLALVQLRELSAIALLAVMAVVWVADIAAYFSGKAFGRHKLAPAISPGKTWEGAAGAGIGVLLYGAILHYGFTLRLDWLTWGLALVLITAVSIVGDLFESLLKRQVGLKDSSNILPGHGGVLDRIDSLTSTLPTVALLWLVLGGQSS